MGWFIKFIDSSIGKKIVMALTGLFLSIFLIAHLAGNLLLLAGDGGVKFEEYANFMAESGNIPVRIVEIALFILLIYHIINGIRITSINRKARNIKYKKVDASANSTFFSRFMIQSGGIIFIFLVIHLRSFFFPYRFSHPEITMYEAVKLLLRILCIRDFTFLQWCCSRFILITVSKVLFKRSDYTIRRLPR